MQLLGFSLGKDSLDDVRRALGPSETKRCSQEESSPVEICYRCPGPDEATVVFSSGFSGAWRVLDGFKIIAPEEASSCHRSCPVVGIPAAGIETMAGLRLGLTRREVEHLLGTPNSVTNDRLSYQWSFRQRMTEEELGRQSEAFGSPVTDPYFDVLDTVELILSGNRVVAVDVSHTVSN